MKRDEVVRIVTEHGETFPGRKLAGMLDEIREMEYQVLLKRLEFDRYGSIVVEREAPSQIIQPGGPLPPVKG